MRPYLLLALVAVAGCSDKAKQQDVDPRILDASRPLVMVTHSTEPPFSYIDKDGNFVGKDIDLARKIAGKMGRPLIVKDIEFTSILPWLKEGKADFGIATITITETRLRDVNFSKPYHMSGACFLYRAGDEIPRMSRLASLSVGVEADTIQDLYLCLHGCDPVRFVDLAEAISALEKKEIDAIFFDAPPLHTLADESGGRFVASPLVTRESYGIAVDKRRPDVLEAANAVIAEGGLE